jgi:photosystem II stability/assembly factor-like uncharacterized protein
MVFDTLNNQSMRVLLAAMFASSLSACQLSPAASGPSTVPAKTRPAPKATASPTSLPTPQSLDTAEQVAGGQAGTPPSTTAVLVLPGPPSIVYAGTWGRGIYTSQDDRGHWTQIDSGPEQVTSLAASSGMPPLLLVGTANLGVLRLSLNGSVNYAPASGLVDSEVRSVAVGPGDNPAFYAGTANGLYHSSDGGLSWALMGLGDDAIDAVTVDGTTGAVYAGTAFHGIQMTTDGGSSWANYSLGSSGVTALMLTDGSGAALLAGTDGRGMARVGPQAALSRGEDQGESGGTASRTVSDALPAAAVTSGPFGGTVTDLKMDPATPTTLYAATEYGVFKTTNNADTWRLTSLSSVDVYATAIDPANPAVVYAATRGQGFFRSTDAGDTWTRTDDPIMRDVIVYSLVVDPSAPNTIYAGGRRAGVDGFTSGDWGGGVFKSTDAGRTWAAQNNGLPEGWVYSLAVDPRVPGRLYAGTHSMGVYKSQDGGASWQSWSDGLVSRYHTNPDNMKIRSLAINPNDPDQLLAGTWGGGSVFDSQDGGATWEYTGNGAEPARVRVVAYNPVDPGLIYAGQREGGVLTKDIGQAGDLWQPFPNQAQGGWENFSVVLAIAISPTDGRTMFLAVEGAGVLRSTDGGSTWSLADQGLLATSVTGIAAEGSDPMHLFASTDGAGVFQSLDGGLTWSRHIWATPWDQAQSVAVGPDDRSLYVTTRARKLYILPIGASPGSP